MRKSNRYSFTLSAINSSFIKHSNWNERRIPGARSAPETPRGWNGAGRGEGRRRGGEGKDNFVNNNPREF